MLTSMHMSPAHYRELSDTAAHIILCVTPALNTMQRRVVACRARDWLSSSTELYSGKPGSCAPSITCTCARSPSYLYSHVNSMPVNFSST